MRIAICEDLPKDMEAVTDLVEQYATQAGYAIEMLCYGEPLKLLQDEQAQKADILLLDIMMPGLDGMAAAGVEIARHFRMKGFHGPIVFTTSSVDYYPEGFEVGATHYLIKPLSYPAFAEAMERAIRQVKAPQKVITVPVNRIQVSVPQHIIRYAEVYGRETQLHTASEQLRVLLPLKKIEVLLGGEPFLRCYRSYIINMDYVQIMEEDHFLLDQNTRIPISLRSRQAIREKFFAYRLSMAR